MNEIVRICSEKKLSKVESLRENLVKADTLSFEDLS